MEIRKYMVLALKEILSGIHVLISFSSFFLAYKEKTKTSVMFLGTEETLSRSFSLFRLTFIGIFIRTHQYAPMMFS